VRNELTTARVTMDRIDRALYKLKQDILLVADEESTERWTQELLERKMSFTGPWDFLRIINKQGEILASTSHQEIGQQVFLNPEDKLAFEAALRGETYHSDFVVSSVTRKQTVIFSTPVSGNQDDGEKKDSAWAVAIGYCSWPAILQLLDEVDPKTRVSLINQEGVVIGKRSYEKDKILTQNLIGVPVIKKVLNNPKIDSAHGTYRLSGDPGKMLGIFVLQRGFLNYKDNGWGLLIEIKASEVFEPVTQMARQIAFFSLLAIVLLAAILGMVGKKLTRPIEELTRTSQLIAKGDLTQIAKITTKDEVGAMAEAFNLMVVYLTERTEDLANQKERLMVTLRSIADAVITTDVAGHVTLINQAAQEVTGWTQEEAMGRILTDIFRIVHEETHEPCENPVDKVLRTGIVVGLANHTVLVSKDGKEKIITNSGAPIRDAKGRTMGVVLVFRDMTEHYQLERMMFQSEKMAALGQLAAGLAHEINNPLTVISGFAQSILKRLSNENELMRMPLENIEREALRCRQLVQDLLGFSRLDKTERRLVDLNEVITASLSILQVQAKAKEIEFETKLQADLPQVQAYRNQIQQVLINLSNNAIDAMSSGGKITLRTLISKRNDKPIAEIQVEDNGDGIPEEIRSKIFEPFFTTKPAGKGTGLGLSLVHDIVTNKHGGEILVESQVGKGTLFRVFLPIS